VWIFALCFYVYWTNYHFKCWNNYNHQQWITKSQCFYVMQLYFYWVNETWAFLDSLIASFISQHCKLFLPYPPPKKNMSNSCWHDTSTCKQDLLVMIHIFYVFRFSCPFRGLIISLFFKSITSGLCLHMAAFKELAIYAPMMKQGSSYELCKNIKQAGYKYNKSLH